MEALLAQSILSITFWHSAIRLSVTTATASIGEIYAEKSGTVNIGLEGMVLLGAFFGAVGSYYTGTPWGGLLCAIIAGIITALLHGMITVLFSANQVVTGTAINILAVGMTSFLNGILLKQANNIPTFQNIAIPGLSTLPFIGEIFFNQNLFVYFLYILILGTWFLLKRTRLGLYLRTVGENPMAADSQGISVHRNRMIGLVICGALAAIGGSFMPLFQLGLFSEEMSGGRGFIALAVVIVGGWKPGMCAITALLFGMVEAFTYTLQTCYPQVPYQIIMMLPYLITIVIYIFMTGRSKAPAALAISYEKE